MAFNKPYCIVFYISVALLCLQTLSIFASPIPIEATDAATEHIESTEQLKESAEPKETKELNSTQAPATEDHTIAGSAETAAAQSSKVPTTAETTIAPTTSAPAVICKDLEMDGSYASQLGSIPKPPREGSRILPINGIKLPKRSCKELYDEGYRKSGLYIIKPCKAEVTVFCDMTFFGGGWTVIQRRLSKSDIFYKFYKDYQQGFGDLSSSMWLGLDTIHCLTSPKSTELFVGLDATNYFYSALSYYGNFSIGDERSKYRLKVSGFVRNLGPLPISKDTSNGLDSLSPHNGQQFSTKDMDNDADGSTHCGEVHKGGWWYKNCYTSNLNGDKMVWNDFIYEDDLTNSVMAVR